MRPSGTIIHLIREDTQNFQAKLRRWDGTSGKQRMPRAAIFILRLAAGVAQARSAAMRQIGLNTNRLYSFAPSGNSAKSKSLATMRR